MIILGAGMTGCLAAYAFKNSVIHEYLETPNTHNAVLRFRSERVSDLTGIPFKKVKVYKGIYLDGDGFVAPNIQLMNMYSRKATGGTYDRSIGDISAVHRWVAPSDFHMRMVDKLGSRIVTSSDIDISSCDRPVISTLPLPVLSNKLNEPIIIPEAENASPIYVNVLHLDNCEVYQTIYFPGYNTNVYRASVTGNQMIVESVHPIGYDEIEMVARAFNIIVGDYIEINKQQINGKFVPLEEEYRKRLMYDLTQKHNIYSLGRHATWRKVLLDDVVQDIDRIERMIKHSAYDLMVGKK